MLDINVLSRSARKKRSWAGESIDVDDFSKVVWRDISIDESCCSSFILKETDHVSSFEDFESRRIVIWDGIQILQGKPGHF